MAEELDAIKAAAPKGYATGDDRIWIYKDAAGVDVMVTARYDAIVADDTQRSKQFKQFSYEDGRLVPRGMAGRRPLYNLGELLARPDAPALVVEGEKTCDAAAELFPDMVVVTSACGSKAAGKTDWSPLQGREVTIWPDNDEPGAGYAKAVLEHVPHARIVWVPAGWPAHWDLADGAPGGLVGADLRRMIADAGNGAAAEPKPTPRTTGTQGNGGAPISQNAKRQRAADKALADKYCNSDGSRLTEDQIKAQVATMDQLEYDRTRKAIAAAAGEDVRASTIDAIRADALADRATSAARAVVTPDPLPWPEPVDGDALLDEILAQARRYVAWPEGGAEAFALWALFAHVFDCFDIAPYLAFISPTPECGKTTSFKLLSRLVPRALISSSTSGAVIPRLIEQIQPTLLADELDTHSEEKTDLWGVLNSGHDREGATYTRCAGADKDEARVYSTWCPKALAKIKKLTPQLVSRSIVVHMKRRAPSERIEKLRPSRRTPHLVELKQKAIRWAADNEDALRDAGDPEMPEALINRRADNWEPLFIVADACGGDWPERARQVAALLSGAEDATLAVELLEDIKKIHDEHPANAHASKDLVAWLGAMEDRPWAEYRRGNEITQAQLAELLKPFGIKPGTVRLGTGTIKGYYVSAFADAFKRYLAPAPPCEPSQPSYH